jgi:hypothetical protein
LAHDALAVVSGMRWRVRHDPEQRLIGIALFGPKGAQPEGNWPPSTSSPIPESLVRDAEKLFGYRVLPIPT